MKYIAKNKEQLYETIEQTSALNEVMALKEEWDGVDKKKISFWFDVFFEFPLIGDLSFLFIWSIAKIIKFPKTIIRRLNENNE